MATGNEDELPDQSRPFSIGTIWDGPTLLVEIDGELDMASGVIVFDIIEAALATRSSKGSRREATISLDTGRLTFVDICGYRALEDVANHAAENGGSMVVRNPAACLVRLFELLPSGPTFRLETEEYGDGGVR